MDEISSDDNQSPEVPKLVKDKGEYLKIGLLLSLPLFLAAVVVTVALYYSLIEKDAKREESATIAEKTIQYEQLAQRLISVDYQIQFAAIREIEALDEHERVALAAALARVVETSDNVVEQRNAVIAFERIGMVAAPYLLDIISNRDHLARDAAISSAARAVSPDKVIPTLLALLSDDDENIRRAAENALQQITNVPARAVDDLRTALKDEENNVRYSVVRLLGLAGSSAQSTLSMLNTEWDKVRTELNSREVHTAFLLGRGLLVSEEQPNEFSVFINKYDILKKEKGNEETTPSLLFRSIVLAAAVQSIEGKIIDNPVEKRGVEVPIQRFSDLGLISPLKVGEAIWLWTSVGQIKAKIQSITANDIGQNFSGIRMTIAMDKDILEQHYILLSVTPLPTQTWTQIEPTPKHLQASQKYVNQISESEEELRAAMTARDWAPGDYGIVEPKVTIVQTKTQGDFMIVQGRGIAAGDGIEVSQIILRKAEGGSAWQPLTGAELGHLFVEPFIDIDGDGVPEVVWLEAYYGGLRKIYPKQEELLSFSTGV